MSIEERLLFLEQIVSILIADKNGYPLDKKDEEMLSSLFEGTYFDI